MANNMIALQARAPSSSGLGNIVQQNSALINMIAQQRAAEAQRAQAAAKAEQDAEIFKQTKAKGELDAKSARLKLAKEFTDTAAFGIANARNADDAHRIGEILRQEYPDPMFQESIAQTLASIPTDPAKFAEWRQDALMRTMESSKQLEFMIPKAKAEVTYGTKGEMQETRTGGVLGTDQGVYPLQTYGLPQAAPAAPVTPTRKGTVQIEPSVTVDPNAEGGPYEPMPAAQSGNDADIRMLSEQAKGIHDEATYQGWLGVVGKRYPDFVAQIKSVAPTYSPEVVSKLIGSANEYLASKQSDGAAPVAAPAVASTAPDFPMVAGPRGGPYIPTGQQAYGRNPSMGQYPGSALVPLSRVADEARVARPSPKEVFTNKTIEADVAANAATKKAAADKRQSAQNFFKITGVDLKTGKDPVAALIKNSTSGTIENFGATLMGAIPSKWGGGATPGRKAIGELKTIAGTVTYEFLNGKLGTGVSNEDRNMVQQMFGQIQDPNVPADERLAAWNRVKKIMASYIGAKLPTGKPAPNTSQPSPGDIDYLRRNRRAPGVAKGFVQHFGYSAYLKAMGYK